MKIQITKLSIQGFQESFSTVEEAFEFFRDKCICSSCKVTQSEFIKPEDMSEDDYEWEKHEMLWDRWDKHGHWAAINSLWDTSCGCEYDVEVIDD